MNSPECVKNKRNKYLFQKSQAYTLKTAVSSMILLFQIFQGKGNRLDGKNKGLEASLSQIAVNPPKR